MHWGKFLAPALFLAPESMGAVVGACPTTPKNGFASSGAHSGNAWRFPYASLLRAVNQCPHLLRKIGKVERIAPQICQT